MEEIELEPFKSDSGLWGYKDKNGDVVINPVYSYANDFFEDFAVVDQKGKKGLINKKGEVVIPCKYISVGLCQYGRVVVKDDEKGCGCLDTKGNTVIPFGIYDDICVGENDLFVVWKGVKCGAVNKNGNVVVPFKYDFIYDLSEGFLEVEKDEKFGFVNENGDEVVRCIYDEFHHFSEGLAAVKKDGEWGFVNTKGGNDIRFEYDFAHSFKYGIAQVRKDGKWFYITKENEAISDDVANTVIDIMNGKFDAINLSGVDLEELSEFNETVSKLVVNAYKERMNKSKVEDYGTVIDECKERLQGFAGKIAERKEELDKVNQAKAIAFNKLNSFLDDGK